MRKRAAVSHISLWPKQEHGTLTHDNLWPQRWCLTWLDEWVLGEVFCCLLWGLIVECIWGRAAIRTAPEDIWALCWEARTFTRDSALDGHPWPYSHEDTQDWLLDAAENNVWHNPTYWWASGVGIASHMLDRLEGGGVTHKETQEPLRREINPLTAEKHGKQNMWWTPAPGSASDKT